MKRPDFQEKTEVKVVTDGNVDYGRRGKVACLRFSIDNGDMLDPVADKDALKHAYEAGLEPKMQWHAYVKFNDDTGKWFMPSDLELVQKKFIDIDYIRENDTVIGKKADGTDAIRYKNTSCFEPGDIIQISTKIDGANASIAWDTTTEKLEVFSRSNLLNNADGLRGFVTYVRTQIEPKADWSEYKNFVFFGEWCVSHSVKYNDEWYNKWRIYDIWCKDTGCYASQERVKTICSKLGLEYIEELYYGPFISWDHCRSFIGKSTAYGPDQEGVVIKNQSKLGNPDNKNPAYIKIVDEKFKEHMAAKKQKTPVDPVVLAERQKAVILTTTVVTEARVKKIILKLVDEGVIPDTLSIKDIGTIMKHVPTRTYDDLIKEEPEIVAQLGSCANKCIAAECAKHVKKIIMGN